MNSDAEVILIRFLGMCVLSIRWMEICNTPLSYFEHLVGGREIKTKVDVTTKDNMICMRSVFRLLAEITCEVKWRHRSVPDGMLRYERRERYEGYLARIQSGTFIKKGKTIDRFSRETNR